MFVLHGLFHMMCVYHVKYLEYPTEYLELIFASHHQVTDSESVEYWFLFWTGSREDKKGQSSCWKISTGRHQPQHYSCEVCSSSSEEIFQYESKVSKGTETRHVTVTGFMWSIYQSGEFWAIEKGSRIFGKFNTWSTPQDRITSHQHCHRRYNFSPLSLLTETLSAPTQIDKV